LAEIISSFLFIFVNNNKFIICSSLLITVCFVGHILEDTVGHLLSDIDLVKISFSDMHKMQKEWTAINQQMQKRTQC
jgi:hypothetical protein